MALRPHEVVMDIDRPAVPFLIIDVAERRAHVGVGQVAAEGQQPVDPHRDVLVLGKLIEISGNTTVERQRQAPRLVEDQEIGVADPEFVTTAARLRRAEQIVEVSAVPGGMRRSSRSGDSPRAGARARSSGDRQPARRRRSRWRR